MCPRQHNTCHESQHTPDCSSIEHGLSSCEGLGHHNHKSRLLFKPVEGTSHIDRIDIGQETQLTPLGLKCCFMGSPGDNINI